MSEGDLSASLVSWDTLLQNPLFKGWPHQNYAQHKVTLEVIFAINFPRWRLGIARTEIYPRVNIPSTVLYEWKAHWSQDPTCRPWDKEIPGKHHRVSSDAEESKPVGLIVNEFIVPGKQFIGVRFRELALVAYMSTERNPSAFKCSQHLINDFRWRHGFSSRRFHIRHRNQHINREDIIEWVENIVVLPSENPPEGITNCDETM
jgi:hypothetical protein